MTSTCTDLVCVTNWSVCFYSIGDPITNVSDLCFFIKPGEGSWQQSETRLPAPLFAMRSSGHDQMFVISGSRLDAPVNVQVLYNNKTIRSLPEIPSDMVGYHCHAKIDNNKIFLAPIDVNTDNRHFLLDLENPDEPTYTFQENSNLPYNSSAISGTCGAAKNSNQEIVVVIFRTIMGNLETYIYNVVNNEFSTGPPLPYAVYVVPFEYSWEIHVRDFGLKF